MSVDLISLTEKGMVYIPNTDEDEQIMLGKADDLMKLQFPEHSLLELWNASIHNLRRRIEMYSVDVFLSSISSISGRKVYKKDGDTLSERWCGVDDSILIEGAVQVGVLNKKAGQALNTINWMRNHASPAHNSEECVTKEDVWGLAILLKNNLFDLPIPDQVHSPVALIEAIKTNILK